MNLFVVGWGLSPEQIEAAAGELRRTAGLYPQLDHAAAWHEVAPGGVLVGSCQTSPGVAAPRRYVHRDDASIVLFDGLPIAMSGGFRGHDAGDLDAHWEDLTVALEGRFGLVRVARRPVRVELVTDPIGVEQVYVHEGDGWSLASNSAGLVQRAIGATAIDPLGASMFLTLDWVGSDRTLRAGVHAMPGGQVWSWGEGRRTWDRREYWSITAVAGLGSRIVDEALAAEVAEPLTRFCAAAAAVGGTPNAPLTGGKDSRLLADILIAGGIPARYWTKGDPGSVDVAIGRQVAARYGLDHRVMNRPTQEVEGRDPTLDVAAEFPTLSTEFVSQNDGLASLFLIGNIQGQPARVDRLSVTFSAMCAESSRYAYMRSYLFEGGASLARTEAYLPYMVASHPKALVSGGAYRRSRRYVRDLVRAAHEAGAAVENLPTMFYLLERCRRWAANNPRELAQTEDKVLPFLTRPYVTSALSIVPDERLTERLHYRMMEMLVPGSSADPPFDKPWRTLERLPASRRIRNGVMSRLPEPVLRPASLARDRLRPQVIERAPFSPYDEESWLEANLGWARELVADRPASPIWDLASRPTMDRLLAERTTQAERRRSQLPLFAALTMLEFERVEAGLGRPPSPARDRPASSAG